MSIEVLTKIESQKSIQHALRHMSNVCGFKRENIMENFLI